MLMQLGRKYRKKWPFKIFILFWLHLKAYGTLALQPRIKPMPLALEGSVLTTGPPGKSQEYS